ncbi:TonB-dependent receptor family protein [Pseudoalteromonas tunicata]|jgi:Fe(3+) dicitrate transport protein|uniref:Putative TonB-dependent receptor protein n=1 Tax=Pseudoalteromonas tunicata D2 TaxID=87626 RepID=A4CD56_9GAMM|nr:TonB-dependent receptor [Pseudoalteromonas tunicata]ATC94006.1 Fe(3+) dicitrate transport protein [Pseudoalteromonas tunicata]AXT29789.1 TonB-dependent receptor [Pseudoalteromonas tunicata]EAR27499.1 putative TonB-dependent receptor protein [Pseudoalteromonas tunicata D2]
MKKTVLAVAIAAVVTPLHANEQSKKQPTNLEHIQIISHHDRLRTESGSATLLTEVELEKFEYDDIHRILSSVPGVNIREEDGYGLRPNIGFRGVTPERSKKITILEDGVLIGPAPYSAPAAYYFPVTTRMTAVEVFKGPAAIKFGPQTVAGTLNMVTRQVPDLQEGGIDIATGQDGYQKMHGYYGNAFDDVSFLVEGVHLAADGFKDLDGGGNTGFDKNDLLAKVRYQFNGAGFEQNVQLKLSYADETSHETYLGLTDSDFSDNPYRRYAATQPALMETEHQQIMLSHNIHNSAFSLTTRLYRNDYERDWLKLNALGNTNASLSAILAEPQTYQAEYAVITGERNSVVSGETSHNLVMGTNAREYYSQGLQLDGTWQFNLFDFDHKLSFGARYHQDEIDRSHFEEIFVMQDGVAEQIVGSKYDTSHNIERTDALAVYIEDAITLDKLTLTAGVRGEFMDMHYHNKANLNDWQDKKARIWLPGISGFYQFSDSAGMLFGVHQGFVPSSPQQGNDIELEKSVNYEFGGRFNDGITQFEMVSFFNDYSNLKESCSQSNCGDDTLLDTEFNGGAVHVYGLESQFAQRYPLNMQLEVPYSVVYTYTKSEFQQEIFSDFVQWGHVKKGDELPYLPTHQATFNIGLNSDNWRVNVAFKYVSSMKEAAGRSWQSDAGQQVDVPLAGIKTDSASVIDVSASYDIGQFGRIYAKIDNITDEVNIISRRPYGARPSKARQFSIGYKYQF